jgi:hypothetical protein
MEGEGGREIKQLISVERRKLFICRRRWAPLSRLIILNKRKLSTPSGSLRLEQILAPQKMEARSSLLRGSPASPPPLVFTFHSLWIQDALGILVESLRTSDGKWRRKTRSIPALLTSHSASIA